MCIIDRVQLPHLQVKRLIEPPGLLDRQAVIVHQLVDIDAVALGGGDPPCGGMGLLQQAQLLQVRHLVADSGRGDVQAGRGGHGLGAHRLRRLDIVFDDGAEDFFLPVAQVHTALTFFSNLSMFKILALNILSLIHI